MHSGWESEKKTQFIFWRELSSKNEMISIFDYENQKKTLFDGFYQPKNENDIFFWFFNPLWFRLQTSLASNKNLCSSATDYFMSSLNSQRNSNFDLAISKPIIFYQLVFQVSNQNCRYT